MPKKKGSKKSHWYMKGSNVRASKSVAQRDEKRLRATGRYSSVQVKKRGSFKGEDRYWLRVKK